MGECTNRFISEWELEAGQVNLDAQDAMTQLTMAIAGRTLFGLDLSRQSERASRGFDTALAAIGRRGPANLQLPLWVPTAGNLRFRRALRELDTVVYEIIRRFRSGQAAGADRTLLGAYLSARDPDTGQGIDDRQLRDEVITLYLAGHETTASLLSWALYWLGKRPDIAERVTAEIDTLVPDAMPTVEQLKRLQHTSRFVNEVLRLYPPAWTIARTAIAEDVIMGYRIPAGAIVMLSPYLAHRWEGAWPDPLRFDPDRFTPEAIKARHPFAYFPFSLGPRICIGMQFSLIEARLVLALILRRFRILTPNGPEIGCVASGTLRPERAIRIDLVPKAQ